MMQFTVLDPYKPHTKNDRFGDKTTEKSKALTTINLDPQRF